MSDNDPNNGHRKTPVEEPIPPALVPFFTEVDAMIKAGDDAVLIPTDDGIQTVGIYGGLIEEGGDRFSFSYSYSLPDEVEVEWTFELSAAEIADIAAGKKTTLRLWRCQQPDCANRFNSAEELCSECDYDHTARDAKKRVLDSFRDSSTLADWLTAYLQHFPDNHPLEVIGDYNSCEALGERWGYFSLEQIEQLIASIKANKRSPGKRPNGCLAAFDIPTIFVLAVGLLGIVNGLTVNISMIIFSLFVLIVGIVMARKNLRK